MIIRDAIHNDIVVEEELIKKLITTFEFQRLRKIKQLGLTYTVFPCAEHTRYTHSLGVYFLAGKMIERIEQERQVRFESIEVEALKAAALLHDIGHGPLSHTAEECFSYSHESYSVRIIQDESTEVNQVLKEYDPQMIEQICMYIEKKHPNPILNTVLSATIDVDRMDYLIRDSHHVGVVYGHFDVDRILKNVTIRENQLVYLAKGKQTLEDFILSRYHMFGQVYLNEHTIGNEQLVKTILNRVKDLYLSQTYEFKTDIKKLIPFFYDEIPVKDYVKMNDNILMNILEDIPQNENDKMLCDLAQAFITGQQLLMEKEVGKEYYEFESRSYKKRIYNESVKVVTETGEVVELEKISQLVNFCKESLLIETESKKYYLEKNEA